MSSPALDLRFSPRYPCEQCGDPIWQVERVRNDRTGEVQTMCSKVCKTCNPWWKATATAEEFNRARAQADAIISENRSSDQ